MSLLILFPASSGAPLGTILNTDTSKYGSALGTQANTATYGGSTLGAVANTTSYP